MDVQTALALSADISKWIDDSTHGLDIPSGDRETLAAALFDQVHEHYGSIQLLIQKSFFGSAASLMRPIFETFIRGVWLQHCASESEVANFAKDKSRKTLGSLIGEIETLPSYNRLVLSKVKKEAWEAMCSYTHGGFLQAARRIAPGEIRPRYSDDEKLEVINSSGAIALLAASEIFSLASRTDLMEGVLDQMRKINRPIDRKNPIA